eukprot:jgi/Antlo1/424/912
MHNGLDEELFFSRKDRHRRAKDEKIREIRKKLLRQKDIGYTEAMERMKVRTEKVLEVFCGYLAGLCIDFKVFYRKLASLLYKSPETLEQRIEFILVNRVQCSDDIYKILDVI